MFKNDGIAKSLLILSLSLMAFGAMLRTASRNDVHFTDSDFKHGVIVRELSGTHHVLYVIGKF